MQSQQWLFVTYVSCISVSLVACDMGGGADSRAHGGSEQLEIMEDGTAILGENTYESVISYHHSPEFRGQGRRCATPEPPISAFLLPSDCSFESTLISSAYNPVELYEIPVVFHIIERSDGYGHVPDELVLSQLDVLNEDFQALAGTPGAAGLDARIRFVLATVDPHGNPTSGITRHVDDSYFYDPGPQRENPMKEALHWDTRRYFNIYSNNGGGNGTLGYATFPQLSAGSEDDGVVLNWAHIGRNAPFGGSYNQGRTATHEVGHYLGLFHTFQDGCGTLSYPYASGDRIADTVPEPEPQFGCAPAPSSCPGVEGSSPIDNYMNYTDDICMTRFTAEQINRMRCALANYRPALLDQSSIPKAAFRVVVNGLDVVLVDDSSDADGTLESWHWDMGDGTSATTQHPAHTYAAGGTYSVSLTVTDNDGQTATSSQNVRLDQPPVASFIHLIEHDIDELTVRFIDESTDADGSIRDRIWSFGDGASSTKTNPRHTYAAPGTYQVVLTVTDMGGGISSTSAAITIKGAPAIDTTPEQEQAGGWGCSIGHTGSSGAPWPNGLGTMMGLLASLLLVARRRKP